MGCQSSYALDDGHFGLVGGFSAFGVWAVAIAELAVGVFPCAVDDCTAKLADGGVYRGDVFAEKGCDSLAHGAL